MAGIRPGTTRGGRAAQLAEMQVPRPPAAAARHEEPRTMQQLVGELSGCPGLAYCDKLFQVGIPEAAAPRFARIDELPGSRGVRLGTAGGRPLL
jgi:hypothetical protein